jgi:hypothetical protein
MTQQAKSTLLTGSLLVLAVVVVIFAIGRMRHSGGDGEAGAQVWFYDQSAKRLYPASRELIPPDGKDEVKVRAMVIGFQGMANKVSQLKIAYLQKFSPELKDLLQRAATAHAAKQPFTEKIPSQSSQYYQDNTYVKLPGDDDSWHRTGSPEARQIMAEWREWRGPAGQLPIISVPSID